KRLFGLEVAGRQALAEAEKRRVDAVHGASYPNAASRFSSRRLWTLGIRMGTKPPLPDTAGRALTGRRDGATTDRTKGSPAKGLRGRSHHGDPYNLIQVMLAKGWNSRPHPF